MPPVIPPQNLKIFQILQKHEQAINAIGSQQQSTITNLQGQPVLNEGVIPGSNPVAYGIQLVNPAGNGEPTGFFGVNGDGVACLQFFDSTGAVVTQFDQYGQHVYNDSGNDLIAIGASGMTIYDTSGDPLIALTGTGLTLYSSGVELITLTTAGLKALNASGTVEALLGLLNASPAIYGLEVRNASGTLQQVSGVVANGPGSLDTSNQGPTAINGTEVTAEIGPSGQALVTICGSAEMNPAGPGGYSYMGVGVDGVAPSEQWVNVQIDQDAQITISVSATQIVSGLSVGSHTFNAYGWAGADVGSAVFGYTYVTVIPQ